MGMSGLESAAADVQVSLKSYARTGTLSAVCADFIFSKILYTGSSATKEKFLKIGSEEGNC